MALLRDTDKWAPTRSRQPINFLHVDRPYPPPPRSLTSTLYFPLSSFTIPLSLPKFQNPKNLWNPNFLSNGFFFFASLLPLPLLVLSSQALSLLSEEELGQPAPGVSVLLVEISSVGIWEGKGNGSLCWAWFGCKICFFFHGEWWIELVVDEKLWKFQVHALEELNCSKFCYWCIK